MDEAVQLFQRPSEDAILPKPQTMEQFVSHLLHTTPVSALNRVQKQETLVLDVNDTIEDCLEVRVHDVSQTQLWVSGYVKEIFYQHRLWT